MHGPTERNRNSQEATLADVLATGELTRRPFRPPDHRGENEALHALTRQMAEQPESLLDNLAATALTRCRAGTAGISLLETSADGEAIFRWAALAGAYKDYANVTVAAASCPCGVSLEREAAQLYIEPGRHFACLAGDDPRIHEALIVPFADTGGYRGTIWVMAHDKRRAFDTEDVRILTALGGFTSAALRHADTIKSQQARETRLTAEFKALNNIHQLTNRLQQAPDLPAALDELLDAAIALHGADMGTLLLYDAAENALMPMVQRGFDDAGDAMPAMIGDNFYSSCGRAMRSRERVVIEDYETDPASASHRPLAETLGYRAACSTPLLTRDADLLAMLTVHFSHPHRPSDQELRMTDLYAWQGAQALERHRSEAALREASRRKDEFLAMLAHELRDPLAPIRNALRVLRQQNADPNDIPPMLDMLERQIGQMVRLVDDLLDVGRITHGRIELKRERVALSEIVEQAEEAVRPSCHEGEVELVVTRSSEALHVHGDAARLTQILGNLLSNACRFTDKGGRIDVIVERADEQAVIRVRDDGAGIATELFPHIFEMFGQADAVRQRTHGGLGIGLTLVRQLAELHGGTANVESAGPGHGSEFVVTLPLADEAEAPEAPEPADDDAPAPKSHRVLVVDDNPDSADSLSLLLELIGHEVRIAHDGLEAVDIAESFRPELALLDIGLPKLDGHEVGRRIRSQPWGRNVILAALTGWGGELDRSRSAAAGFDTHLVKPIDDSSLMKLLSRLPAEVPGG